MNIEMKRKEIRRKYGRNRRRSRLPAAVILTVLAAGGIIWGAGRLVGGDGVRPIGAGTSLVMEYAKQEIDLSGLHSRAGIIVRLSDGEVIAETQRDERIYPASLTKIMTCLLAIENIDDLEAEIRLPEEIFPELYAENASMAGFLPGEHVKIIDLLYGIILPSGGECSTAAAGYASGSEEAFVELMNEKAQELGMKNTHFENSTGLHDENHYSTVGDLALLLQYAVKNETFEEIFCSREHFVESTDGHPEGLMMRNSMFKLRDDWTVENGEIRGGKTGFTDEAGLCLASEAMIGNEKYIAVTTGAEGNHSTEPYHVLDAFYLYGQLDNRWKVRTDE